MKSFAVIAAASALFASGVVAQTEADGYNFTYTGSDISSATVFTWCKAELESCPKICGGAATTNTCDETDLTYNCTCDNGTSIDVSAYTQTLPFFICQATFAECEAYYAGEADAQQGCTDHYNTCGSLSPDNVTSGDSSSSSSSSSASASASASETAAATSASASASATSTTAASFGVKVGQSAGVPILAAGFAIAARLFL